MKAKITTSLFLSLLLVSMNLSLKAQLAFNKGSLIVSVSEGNLIANYTTFRNGTDGNHPVPIHQGEYQGVRDPFILEYGITKRIGIGLTSGTDIFKVSPSKFYGFKVSNDQIKVTTSELTFDSNFHFLVNKRLDVAALFGYGMFSVAFKGKDNDATPYNYTANGGMVRTGLRVHYYFWRKFGAFGMLSTYAGKCSPKDAKGKIIANSYSTKISGTAVEIGLCYRFIK